MKVGDTEPLHSLAGGERERWREAPFPGDPGASGAGLHASSENPSWANIAPLLFFQKTLEIYSVELSGTKDIAQTDRADGKEKYRGLKNRFEPRKNHQKEELKKELDLVS